MAKVLIAEDHALVRQGMRVLLETEGYDVAEVEDGAEAFKQIRNGGVDLALLDIGLPVRSGVDVLQEVRRRELPTRVIVMTGDTDHYSPADLYAMGADAFVYKTADADHLMDTIAAVLAGRVLPQQNSDSPSAAAVLREQLTDRERQIVKLVVEGASNRQAADILSISEHTVRKHREHINRKLDIHSPAALATFAIRSGLV